MRNCHPAPILLAAALFATTAHASILVKDSFDADGYTLGRGLKNINPGNTTGFTSAFWGGGNATGVFFVNDGLTFPNDFLFVTAGNAVGVGKHSGNGAGDNPARRMTRTIDANVIPAAGTYYFRFACEIGDAAELHLSRNYFETIGLVPTALVDSTGIGVPPNIGVHIGFLKTAAQNSRGMDIALWIAGSKKATLASNITASKTYLVVAKIEIDAGGTASVSALAGDSDDYSLRTASLPAPVTGSVGTDPLRHLCLSGVYMSDYATGKYATFDEVAIGETLDDVFGFVSASVPVVQATGATSIGETGFTANGTLSNLGSSNPELFFDLSDDGTTWTATSMGTYSATGDVSHNATGLLSGSTYQWRLRAVGPAGASTSVVEKVTLAGAPVFGDPSATPDGNAEVLAVSLTQPGLSGVAPTTVELWFAPGDNPLALQKIFPTVIAATDFSETMTGLDWGASYRYAFRGTVPYNGGILETWTATNTVDVTGDDVWTGGSGTIDWHTPGNWSLATVPTANLTAWFTNVGGRVTANADAAAGSVYINTTGGDGTTLDLGGRTLTVDWFGVGREKSNARATISNGVFTIQTLRAGESGVKNTLVVGDGAKLNAGSAIYVGADNDPLYASNKLVFARGSKTTVEGSLMVRIARGNRVEIEEGASVTTKGLMFPACPTEMVVDGGAFTNTSTSTMLNSNRRGKLAAPMFLEFRNGAIGRFQNNMHINSGLINGGSRYHAEVRVFSGATLDARGSSIYLDHSGTEGSTGSGSDSGGGAAVVVSNATLKAKTINIAVDDRRNGDELRIYEDDGETTLVEISASARVSSSTWTRSNKCNYGHRILVEGGALAIAENLQLGDGGQYYALHDNNHLAISRHNARVTLGALNVYGKSYVAFTIPAGGFDQVPLQVTGKADFGIVPTGAEAAVAEVHVDATDFTGKQTLLTAGSLSGLTANRVVVTVPKLRKVSVSLTETTLSVTVAPSTTVILFH